MQKRGWKSWSNQKGSFIALVVGTLACSHSQLKLQDKQDLIFTRETHFKSLRLIARHGRNILPRWSLDDQWIGFQHRGRDLLAGAPSPESKDNDQVYLVKADGSKLRRISPVDRTANYPFFLVQKERVLFTLNKKAIRTQANSDSPLSTIVHSQIISVFQDGGDPIPLEPGAPTGYNSEGTGCKDGSFAFVSNRRGNPQFFVGTTDSFGTAVNLVQITQTVAPRGGISFSPSCKKVTWHQYEAREGISEIWIANSDGSEAQPVTHIKKESTFPSFTPDGKGLIFSSNSNGNTELYLIRTDGTELTSVTSSGGWNSHPAFSADGKFLLFSSNRGSQLPEEASIFVAEWQK